MVLLMANRKGFKRSALKKNYIKLQNVVLGNDFSDDILSVIIGNWSKNIVQIDFDKMPLDKVRYYAFRA